MASLAPAHSEPAPLGDVVQEAKEQSRAYRAGLLRELGVTAKEVAVARKAPTFDLVTRNGTDGDYNFVEVKWRNMVGVVGPGGPLTSNQAVMTRIARGYATQPGRT